MGLNAQKPTLLSEALMSGLPIRDAIKAEKVEILGRLYESIAAQIFSSQVTMDWREMINRHKFIK